MKRLIVSLLAVVMLILPVSAAAGSSIPTAFFYREDSNLVLNANSSTYSQYIIGHSKENIDVYLTTDPNTPDFVLLVEAIDYRTHEVVDSMMLMMFQNPTPNYYGFPLKKLNATAGHCYIRFSNLSNTTGRFTYQLY